MLGTIARANAMIKKALEEVQKRMLKSEYVMILKADDFNWVHVCGMMHVLWIQHTIHNN